MTETMHAAPGIGLAASQVGVEQRIALVDLSVGEKPEDLFVLINPTIQEEDGTEVEVEGCLSIPDFSEKVTRPKQLTLAYQNCQGEVQTLQAEGWLARAICHELDHLDGVLFVDHLKGLRREKAKRALRRMLKRVGMQLISRVRFRPHGFFLCLLALPFVACGGGGGGSGPTPPPPPTTGVTFSPSTPSGANQVLMAHENPGSSTTFVLQINADQMTGLYGLGFDVTYPSAHLSFVSAEEGPFLQSGGAGTSLQVAELAPGTLIVGASRLGTVGTASGSGTIVRLTFSVGSTGNGTLAFANRSAFSANGAPRGDVVWFGGSLSVVR